MLAVSSENPVATLFFLFPGIGVATSILCRNPTLSAFTAFMCRDLDSMSRPHLCCQPLCFLVTAHLFMLRRHSIFLSLQVGCDSTLLVYLFSCRNVVIKSRPSNLCNQCNSCRDLKSMSRLDCSSFFAEIFVATSIPCHDIISLASYIDLGCDHIFLTL